MTEVDSPPSNAYPVALRWRDLDNQGHVYHGTMLTLLDEARTKWFTDVVQGDSPDSFVLARIEVDYRNPLKHSDDHVLVGFELVHVGTTSIVLAESMRSGTTGQLIAEAVATTVLWDRAAETSRPISDEERGRLDGHSNRAGTH